MELKIITLPITLGQTELRGLIFSMASTTQRFRVVISAVVAAMIFGWLIEHIISAFTGWPFGHTQYGHLAGWLGFALILLTLGYSLKKRFGRKTGWPKLWFWLHQLAGVIGALLIFIHAGIHFHALVPVLTLSAMVIVVASGIVGVFVHRKALSLLSEARKDLLKQGLSEDEVSGQLFDLAAQEKIFRIWRALHVPIAIVFGILTLFHIGGALYFGGL